MQLSVVWLQFVDFNVLWEGKLSYQECPFSNFQIALQHGATEIPCIPKQKVVAFDVTCDLSPWPYVILRVLQLDSE